MESYLATPHAACVWVNIWSDNVLLPDDSKPLSIQYWLVINSTKPSDAYMRQQARPSLVQIMACHLIGTKQLSEAIVVYR